MPPSLRVRAINPATDSENRIHENSVAAQYGFCAGLVPGVTIYGYMGSAVIERLGLEWLSRGAFEVRFIEPYYDGEYVDILLTDLPERRIKVEANDRASGIAWFDDTKVLENHLPECPLIKQIASRETIQTGKILGTLYKTLDLAASSLSAPFDSFIGSQRLAHPAVILGLANELLMHNYFLGPWIHAASEVRNVNPIRDGDHLQVRGKIVDAYERKGHEFVVLDVAVLSGEVVATRIRHTAIWKPRK